MSAIDARWLEVFKNAGWGVAIASKDGASFEAMNPAFARMHGYIQAELAGLAGGFVAGQRRDGTTFPVSVDETVVKDASGEVAYRVVLVQDLTEQNRRARESDLSREVLDGLHEGCQVIDRDFRYLYVNAAVAAQGRTTPEALLGRTMMECYPGIEATGMFPVLERCMRERAPDRFENDFSFQDGTRSCFELRFVPIPQGVCILSVDITERRHRLAAIVNDSDDAIIGQTLDGVVTSWNRGAERMFGYTEAEVMGRTLDVLSPIGVGEADNAARVARGERISNFETTRLCKDGRRVDVSITQSPVRGANGEIVGLSKIARDITEGKRVERELVQANEETERVNRELESFSYSVAHDLRAPLRSIDGFSQALLEDYGASLDDQGQKYLRYVRESAQLMARLIDDMLTLSRVTRSELVLEPVDISALARATVDSLRFGSPGREVDVAIQDGLVGRGDGRLLAVVFDNLLGNAWKFTSRTAHAKLEVGSRSEGGRRVYFVRDNGAGFDPTYVHKLFGVFQRLHTTADFEGTGVGLATVQRIIHRHGGRVWADGQVGRGATVSFTLDDEGVGS